MTNRVPLSILDLAPVSQGSDAAQALRDSTELARRAEDQGYARFWMAEHHGSATFASSATAVLLAHVASATSRIRVGSGGVMLPNHAPLMVAEYYGTLATLYGPRIDLGLGRAPGTDPTTAAALRRSTGQLDSFAADVADLVAWFAPADRVRHLTVRALPGEGTQVPLWMLGSSLGGASVAAALGLPFAFASHFAPDHLTQALEYYRANFNAAAPTAQADRPYVMAGINVLAAPTAREAEVLRTSSIAMTAQIRTGNPGPLLAPDERLLDGLDPRIASMVDQFQSVRAVGTPAEVVAGVEEFVVAHDLDEVITTTYTWDPELRRRSYELLADAWGPTPTPTV
ncbi:MAG: LLM class flavin-dependent oxidoreductase [Micrococcales bacterium]|nr:LLM class flavin-dependent oxidoreductase [Micrococcales bacterium]